MTRDDIIRMAEEASGGRHPDGWGVMLDHEQLERFAALIVAAEREWVDLTATEIKLLRRAATSDRRFAELIQAKLKEKNGG
jgi:hypothetical protein